MPLVALASPLTLPRELSRRAFLADLGRGTVALAVAGLAACGPSGGTGGASSASAVPATSGSSAAPGGSPSGAAASGDTGAAGAVEWERVDLGFVSAYVLARGGEAVVVDTGTAGSEGDIESVLGAIGLGWDAVGHVILTHLHGDHAGSAAAVLEAAADAVGYAGEADIPGISAPRPLTAVADGDEIFGLRIVATPGHTAGHIAVLDPIGGILVAGDALGTDAGAPIPPNESFTEDMATAMQSVAKLGELTFETLLVGHGDPITSGASGLVAGLATGS
jgi:glyoxylase-like metal-dependent hydrolase (beta-lactamase superfamily II)